MLQGTTSVLAALVLGVVGILFVVWQMRTVLRFDTGTDRMREIAAAIQEGASAFLRREYALLAGFVAVVSVIKG